MTWPPPEQLTADGYDLTLGTNLLGPFYFTKLLLPMLIESAKDAPGGKVRIVNTASVSHWWAALDFSYLKDSEARLKAAKKKPGLFYNQSKLVSLSFQTSSS